MNRSPLLLICAGLVLLAMVLAAGFFREKTSADGDVPSNAVKITIASSSTKKEWIDDAVKKFNAASRSNQHLQVQGRPIYVQVLQEEVEPGKFDHYRSGTMVSDTLSGKITPTILSPAEGSWIDQLNSEWEATHGKLIVTGKPTPLV